MLENKQLHKLIALWWVNSDIHQIDKTPYCIVDERTSNKRKKQGKYLLHST